MDGGHKNVKDLNRGIQTRNVADSHDSASGGDHLKGIARMRLGIRRRSE